ncbi:serine protease [Nocardiopsis sp. EMB25]|uniref:S1 family peptidase n=1 Tax=Nocardiopsis sp. EMB25 TaxID=2835867 RepID=UPI002284AFFB|nr:serine protease [Nocardiopsis sp. EMB25]MCY9784050.1 serine protease [Nocardiopsis sp. EMB25]
MFGLLALIAAQAAPSGAVVGGVPANMLADRYVIDRMGTLFGAELGPFCGGTVLDEWTVLTAASCVVGLPESADLYFNRGDYDLWTAKETENEVVRVERVIAHPRYAAHSGANDIAVLKVAGPMGLAEEGTREHMWSLGDTSLERSGTRVTMYGWGTISSGGSQPGVLRKAETRVASHDACEAGHGSIVTDDILCLVAFDAQRGSCQGDEGGPVLAADANGRRSLIGVLGTQGIRCALHPYESTTRVSGYRAWIVNRMGAPA